MSTTPTERHLDILSLTDTLAQAVRHLALRSQLITTVATAQLIPWDNGSTNDLCSSPRFILPFVILLRRVRRLIAWELARQLRAMSSREDFTLSTLSLSSTGSQNEDWDKSEGDIRSDQLPPNVYSTPRNSVVFPGEGNGEETPGRYQTQGEKGRSLSELLRLHAETGTDVKFSAEEASRVGDVLNQWVRG